MLKVAGLALVDWVASLGVSLSPAERTALADPAYGYRPAQMPHTWLRTANLVSAAANHEKAARTWREEVPKLREIAESTFPRQKDLERKTKRLAEIESDMALNPVPAPAWLRHGAPLESTVYYRGRPLVVDGHQWAEDGYFLFVLDKDQPARVPYLEIKDANGQAIYEEHSFVPPTTRVGEVHLPGLWVVTPPADLLRDPNAGLTTRGAGANWQGRAATVAAGGRLSSAGRATEAPMTPEAARARLNNLLGPKVARMLLEGGIIRLERRGAVVDWQFTTDDAHIKLKRLYPQLKTE